MREEALVFVALLPQDAAAVTGLLFFFSSRRRHTRFSRDWSSDVCSSDLVVVTAHQSGYQFGRRGSSPEHLARFCVRSQVAPSAGCSVLSTIRWWHPSG